MVVFTTGRGSAFGSKPAPTIKVATNSEMYGRMTEDMDVNAGEMLTGAVSLEDKGREIYEMILRVASGAALDRATTLSTAAKVGSGRNTIPGPPP